MSMNSKWVFSIVLAGILAVLMISVPSSADKEYDGYWITQGYGMYLDIKDGQITSYQISDRTILELPLLDGKISNSVLESTLSDFRISRQDQELYLEDRISGHIFKAYSTELSPEELKDERQKDDPYYNFEVFWDSFNEHYAFFDLYGIEWKMQYDRYYPKLTQDMDSEELMDILTEMVGELNDDHVSIEYGGEEFSSYKDSPKWLEGSGTKELVEVIDQQYAEDMTYLSDRRIRYGWMDEKIAYMNLAVMASDESAEESLKELIPAFEKSLKELQHAPTLVLDLRFNQGGHDAVSLAYAGYFTDKKRPVFKKQGRDKDSYTELTEICIQPADSNVSYDGNVIVLTSQATVSAAEIFLLAMEQLPNAKIVGEETAGFYSDALPRILPNGAAFTLSSERYYTVKGDLLEGKGIKPSVHIPIDLAAKTRGKDPALDWVLKNY